MAYCVIDDFTVPDSLPEGAEVTVKLLLRNAGSDYGGLDYYIEGNPEEQHEYIFIGGGRSPILFPGEILWVDVLISSLSSREFKMPAYHFLLKVSNEDGTSSIIREINLGSGPQASITDVNLPDGLNTGDSITGYIKITNIGGSVARMRCLFVTEWNGTPYGLEADLEAGQTLRANLPSLTMPSQDAMITISGQRLENGVWVTDDVKTH